MSTAATSQDFDFLIGRWKVRHRRLKERLRGCEDWEYFEGRCHMWPLMNGLGNVDDNVLELPGGTYRATALRTFDPATRQWAIWWVDGRNPHRLEPPVVGGFADGVGEFQCNDELRGQPIRVRFRWTATDSGRPHWQQAFSADGGRTWEANWEMDFERLAEAA
ncbi:DUF1579 domain-containing protein [Roseateles sp.]|uniref:DUF1579 domain-containing protein n=1 Tax=Roseateles sp. TaxID=1971397 RepID=UPI0025E3A874|nr:DUF1579 domain-containing protein [Roseateles sp.]MBV8034778.1 DUF1579 domain-containing protein [Roseateles sp.]